MTAERPKTGTEGRTAAELPQRIGPYRVLGRLGRGGMAEVLLAFGPNATTGEQQLLVVKRMLPASDEKSALYSGMFLDEARLALRLHHANIVRTYQIGFDGATPYMVMEFLQGQTLNTLQRRAHGIGQPVPLEVTLRICCDALEGLHYAHELRDLDGVPMGVVHRDVTPSNLFVEYGGMTRIVDFGIAKSRAQVEKTRAGFFKGKIAYMAPERFLDRPVDRSVDIWAMGVVIWETLAGERLFRGSNDFETIRGVMNREVPRLSQRRPDVPAALDEVLAAAIERDAARRIPTAEQLREQLEQVAFAAGRSLRRPDVARLMEELFGEAIAVNRRYIDDLLGGPDPRPNEPSNHRRG